MSAGLDALAAVIAERAAGHGARLFVGDDGRVAIFVTLQDPGGEPATHEPLQEGYRAGALAELGAIVGAVPGMREALQAHARAAPVRRLVDGVIA